jgi:hypothetical protein
MIGGDGRFCDVATIDIGTDTEACEIATTLINDHPAVEVWQDARRVALVTRDGIQTAKPAG